MLILSQAVKILIKSKFESRRLFLILICLEFSSEHENWNIVKISRFRREISFRKVMWNLEFLRNNKEKVGDGFSFLFLFFYLKSSFASNFICHMIKKVLWKKSKIMKPVRKSNHLNSILRRWLFAWRFQKEDWQYWSKKWKRFL